MAVEKTKDALFTPDELKALAALAKRRGFKTPRDYLRTLIGQDAKQHDEPTPIENDDELPDPVESFRVAWGEAMRGELLTEEEFWKAVGEDD